MTATNLLSTKIPHLKLVTGIYLAFLASFSLFIDFDQEKHIGNALKQWPASDKVLHLLLIGIVAFLINQNLKNRTVKLWKANLLLGSIIIAVLFTFEEFSQMFIATRSFSLSDLSANYLGILIFGQLSVLKQYYENRKSKVS